MTQFDINQIQKILPHRYPFLMVDRVIEVEPGKTLTAIKNPDTDAINALEQDKIYLEYN